MSEIQEQPARIVPRAKPFAPDTRSYPSRRRRLSVHGNDEDVGQHPLPGLTAKTESRQRRQAENKHSQAARGNFHRETFGERKEQARPPAGAIDGALPYRFRKRRLNTLHIIYMFNLCDVMLFF